jgi:hypothetical protein
MQVIASYLAMTKKLLFAIALNYRQLEMHAAEPSKENMG